MDDEEWLTAADEQPKRGVPAGHSRRANPAIRQERWVCRRVPAQRRSHPSREDSEITRRLRVVGDVMGVRVLDHIIIGNGRCVAGWRRRSALLTGEASASARAQRHPLTE